MARKTALDKLNDALSDILNQYAGEVQDNVAQIAEDMGRRGVQALRAKSRETFPVKGGKSSGKYARGWTMQTEKTRLGATVTIYNEHPGMPHLLEHGHVNRNGTRRTFGQTPGHEHIKPVADELAETFEREVVSKL